MSTPQTTPNTFVPRAHRRHVRRRLIDTGRPGVDTRPALLVLVVAIVALGWIVSSPLLAVVGPPGFALAQAVRRRRQRRRETRAAELAVVALADQLAVRLRGGQSLAGAIRDALADAVETDLAGAVTGVVDALAAGEGLATALGRADTAVPSLGLLVAALTVLVEQGGPAALALERFGDTLRAGVEGRAEARVQASQATASAALLAALPVVFGGGVAIAEPTAAAFYAHTWTGAACVATSSMLTLAGWHWIEWLTPR